MKPTMACQLLSLLACAGLLGAAASGTAGASDALASGRSASIAGVQKVINMLADMGAKVKKEKADEEVAFATFQTWCTQESASLKSEIKKNGETIELLESEIGTLQSEIKGLEEAITQLKSNIESYEADKSGADAQREKDHADFLAESQDYSESVDALNRAIAVMQKQSYDRPGAAAALLQIVGKNRIPTKAKALMSAFLGMVDAEMQPVAPEANAYEFQSSNVVDMLKRLNSEFTDKLGQCQKEEMNSKHAYDMVVADLVDSIENSNKDMEAKTVEKQTRKEKVAENKKQLATTIDVKAENEKTLAAMTTECSEKSMSFEEKQQLRTEEIEAIAKAMEILQSPEVSGNADKYLDLAQAGKAGQSGKALLQVDDRKGQSQGIRHRVREFLTHEGKRLRSHQLGLLAEKIQNDPFAKVKQLIDTMITRLLEEAKADADHEGFCDTEIGKSKITRTKLSEDIDSLDAAVEDGKATIMTLTEDTATLSQEVVTLQNAMKEATEIRKADKAKNAQTVEDATAAQTAVAAATAVLKDFYEKASQATGFLQLQQKHGQQGPWAANVGIKMGSEEWHALANPAFQGTVDKGHKAGMQTFGDAYQGQQDEAGGVLGMLEVIASDFANLEADTKADEAQSQQTYDAFMTESKKNKAMKEKKIEMNNADRTTAESKLQADIADLKSTQDELLAADRYYDKLVPQCIDQGQTFEERTKSREDEIASLKKALQILNSEDISTSS